MKSNFKNSTIDQFRGHSLENSRAIFGGTSNTNGDNDDDDTEKKGLQVPTNGHS